MSGYRHPLYAAALEEWGRPILLPASGGWILACPLGGSAPADGCGPYPLFCCGDVSRLGEDLGALPAPLVALSLVMDPFAEVDSRTLADWFPDVCRAFKTHYVVDLSLNWRRTVCRHHRRNVRSAAQRVDVERCDEPARWLRTWISLYAELASRHELRGMAAFSPASFARQLRVPGMAAYRAVSRGETVAMQLWCESTERAYYHLGAASAAGYECGAAFALFDVVLGDQAARGVRWADLGGAAGWRPGDDDGLARFKQGWANSQRPAWFCGRIFDQAAYHRLVALRDPSPTSYFPPYRAPEAA
jgi:hypothetical protein